MLGCATKPSRVILESPPANEKEESIRVLEPAPSDRERLAGRPAGPMRDEPSRIDAARHDLLGGQGLQVPLGGGGDDGQIGDGPDVLGLDPLPVEERAVVGNAMVGVGDQTADPLVLEGDDVRAGRTRVTQQ